MWAIVPQKNYEKNFEIRVKIITGMILKMQNVTAHNAPAIS